MKPIATNRITTVRFPDRSEMPCTIIGQERVPGSHAHYHIRYRSYPTGPVREIWIPWDWVWFWQRAFKKVPCV